MCGTENPCSSTTCSSRTDRARTPYGPQRGTQSEVTKRSPVVPTVISRWSCALRLAFLAAILVVVSPATAQAGDPTLNWWTIHTPHARIHYDKSIEEIADRVADLFERLHTDMGKEFGWFPSQIVEIVLTDDTDGANGSATAFPFNTIRLYVTAPDDMSPLGDHDD